MYLSLERGETENLLRLEEELHEELNDIFLHEEFLLFKKSHEKWVKFGDRNLAFSHIQTIVRNLEL